MKAFRVMLVVLWLAMAGVTVIVIAHHGLNLFEVFFGDIRELSWRGQFNVDFASYLILSALWLMWRHDFSAAGIALGIAGFFGGALFLTAYLLFMSFASGGDTTALLLGERRRRMVSATGGE